MTREQMIREYLNRGFSIQEVEHFEKQVGYPLEESCDYCSSCNYPILHDDEVYTCPENHDWLCEDCNEKELAA